MSLDSTTSQNEKKAAVDSFTPIAVDTNTNKSSNSINPNRRSSQSYTTPGANILLDHFKNSLSNKGFHKLSSQSYYNLYDYFILTPALCSCLEFITGEALDTREFVDKVRYTAVNNNHRDYNDYNPRATEDYIHRHVSTAVAVLSSQPALKEVKIGYHTEVAQNGEQIDRRRYPGSVDPTGTIFILQLASDKTASIVEHSYVAVVSLGKDSQGRQVYKDPIQSQYFRGFFSFMRVILGFPGLTKIKVLRHFREYVGFRAKGLNVGESLNQFKESQESIKAVLYPVVLEE